MIVDKKLEIIKILEGKNYSIEEQIKFMEERNICKRKHVYWLRKKLGYTYRYEIEKLENMIEKIIKKAEEEKISLEEQLKIVKKNNICSKTRYLKLRKKLGLEHYNNPKIRKTKEMNEALEELKNIPEK